MGKGGEKEREWVMGFEGGREWLWVIVNVRLKRRAKGGGDGNEVGGCWAMVKQKE